MQDEAWNTLLDGENVCPVTLDDSPALAAAFAPLREARQQQKAFVVAQLGLSLDGRIATESGDSKYINGQHALTHLHRLRALVDAVIVGAGTARADDPQLTVRLCAGDHPARVVIDPHGTIPASAKVWTDTDSRCLVFGGADDLPAHVERLSGSERTIPVAEIVRTLSERGLTRLLVEGGADTLGRFLAAGAVDSLHLLYGRVILGSGRAGVSLPPISALSEARRPAGCTHVFPDGDLLVTCNMQERH